MLGVSASEETIEAFNEMKLKHKVAYMLFKTEGSKIVVEKSVLKENCEDKADWRAEFVAAVKETGQPRFAVVDWNNKLLFVAWVPDTSKGKDKMVYASVKEQFAQQLVGVHGKLQATDDGELNEDIIAEKNASNV